MKKRVYGKECLRSILQDSAVMEELRQANGKLTASTSEAVAEAMGSDSALRLLEGVDPGPGAYAMTEAIVQTTGRPALLIRDGKWETPKLATIKQRLDISAKPLRAAIPKVGRVELLNHPNYAYVGTAWMVEEDVAITNRHVASIFARRETDRILIKTNPFGESFVSQVDFNEEHQSPNPPFEVAIEEVLYIEEDASYLPDMALVRLKKVNKLPAPVEFLQQLPAYHADIAVVGYPARDSRNDPFVMDSIFHGIYEVKRLSPGRVTGVRQDGFIMTHDCTTLGGNSGSVVLDLATGKAVALHYAGSYLENNYAVLGGTILDRLARATHRVRIEVGATAVEERVVTKNDLAGRPGYDPGFLGVEVPLPTPSKKLEDNIAPVTGNKQNLLNYTHYSLMMHKKRKLAVFTACNIDGKQQFLLRRGRDSWALDPRVDHKYQADNSLYKNNRLDRGHLVRRLDPTWGKNRAEAKQAEEDTFFYTNCSPQHDRLNQHTWLSLEDYILDNAMAHDLKVTVFTGPVFASSDPKYRGYQLPQEYWKVVVMVDERTESLSATAYLLSQVELLDDLEFVYGGYKNYQLPITDIEKRTGLSFGDLAQFDPLARAESHTRRILTSPEEIVL